LKRVRSSERKRLRNRAVRSTTRTMVKKARTTLEQGDLEAARQAIREAVRTLDKAVSKGVIHRNSAARRKSRLMKRLAALEAKK
jgi:small subunit ribosomal protein S20